jgi:hypothetical protein
MTEAVNLLERFGLITEEDLAKLPGITGPALNVAPLARVQQWQRKSPAARRGWSLTR